MKNDRKIKGSSQNIFLIETIMPESEKEKKFDVMGSTGNVYTVTIKDIPECTCPDFRLRNKRCKHIYFILIKVMKTYNEDEDIYEEDDLKIMFSNIPEITQNLIADKEIRKAYKKLNNNKDEENYNIDENDEINSIKKSVDDICPICLEDLNDGQDLDFCKNSCGKSIHKICFMFWCKKNKPTCVFCRSDWHSTKYTNQGFKYINILNKNKK